MPLFPPRVVVALLVAAMLFVAPAASAQTSTIPETGAGVSATPPVSLAGSSAQTTSAGELPNTGADPRILFLAGLALTLLGFGLRLRTADADDD